MSSMVNSFLNAAAITPVVQRTYTPATSQVVSLAGAAAGNLAVVVISNSLSPVGPIPSGWTLVTSYQWATFGYNDYVVAKVLTSGDITTGSVTFTGLGSDGTLMLSVYSGPTSAVFVSSVGDTTTATTTIPGFTKNAAAKGLLLYSTSRNQAATLVAPGVTSPRIASFATAHFCSRLDDVLSAASYTDGSNLSYTGGGTETIAMAFELR